MPALHIEDLPEKEKLKLEVEQLRKEVKLQRQQVSKCSEEIKNYIEERSGEDPLVKGIPEDKNPFKEKRQLHYFINNSGEKLHPQRKN